MKLSRETNTNDVIRVVRIPVVHVHTLRIKVTNVDEVAVRRLLSVAFSLLCHREFTSLYFL